MDKRQKIDNALLKIKEEIIACKKCPLYKTRTLPVIGQGSHQADIMFVGEAPGRNENLTGRPFCGKAGDILSDLLSSIGLRREDVYITNILKCRPPSNRNPQGSEIKACVPYLDSQIELINPKIIAAMGNFAAAYILEKFGLKDEIEGISRIHGKVFASRSLFGEKKIVPLYHPAVATYNINKKSVLEEDFAALKKLIS